MNSSNCSRRKFLKATTMASSVAAFLLPEYLKASTTDSVTDLEKITNYIKGKEQLTWVFTGDSITQGVKHTHGYRCFSEIFAERIRWEIGRANDVVINTGISGNVASQILKDFENRIGRFKPAVVFLMIGTNDCGKKKNISLSAFEEHLNKLVLQIRSKGAIPVLLTPNLIITGKSPDRELLPEYIKIIQQVADYHKLILVDNWTEWIAANELLNTDSSVFKDWLNDPIHPNQNGHKQIAYLIFKSLLIFQPESPACGGIYYEGTH